MRQSLRYALLFSAILLAPQLVRAQELERLLMKEQSTDRAEERSALVELSQYYENQGEYLKAFDYWNKCSALEQEITGTVSIQVATGEAESLYNAGQYQLAIERFDALLQRFHNNDDSVHQYPIWIHCIDALDKTEKYDAALSKYSMLIVHFAMSKNPAAFAAQLNHMGILEKKKKDLTNAFDYFTNARQVVRANHEIIPVDLQREIYSNMAVTHAERKEYITSLSYFQTAEAMLPVSKTDKAALYNLKGATYLLMGRYEDAQKTGMAAIELLPKSDGTLKDRKTRADSYDLLARVYKDRDWPTYQKYYNVFLDEKQKINDNVQHEEEKKLLLVKLFLLKAGFKPLLVKLKLLLHLLAQ